MTTPPEITFVETDLDRLADFAGRVVVLVGAEGKLDPGGRRVNKLTRGALERFCDSDAFAKLEPGDARDLAWPTGMAAEAVQVVRLDRRADVAAARKAGVAVGRGLTQRGVLILAGSLTRLDELALGALLRGYDYRDMRGHVEDAAATGTIEVMCGKPDAARAAAETLTARAAGVFLTRDLVNAPSNILTPTAFAEELDGLSELGVSVEILDEADLDRLGMRLLLAVGQGSAQPSKVVVMRWEGDGDAPPLALCGKGVTFDTGGISIKPASGMEDMTMDMGGAGTVAGVMKTLALRKARANVVGVVGLVENMPSSTAYRPGDVVRSMKGDTVEVINTDAEGRLVLADVMWYTQDRFEPAGMIDLATLTGAIIISLGHEKAGVFSNHDGICDAFLKAAEAEQEGAWRLPLGPKYDEKLKSRVADFKNVGGREAGSITAGQFLQRFVKDDTPWIHLDIAGVASLKSDGPASPKGASGWGVLALDRLIRDRYETAE